MVLNYVYDKSLEKVEYTDDPKCLSPKLFDIGKSKLELKSAMLGKYKNTYWEFQSEERYILRFLPFDVKKLSFYDKENINIANIIYKNFTSKTDFLSYYDLQIRDDAYASMEITLSPQFSAGNRILLETLLGKYNPNITVLDSALKDRIRL